MGEFSSTTVAILQTLSKRAVQGQGGLLTGQDPATYNTADPLRLWIIQLGVIIMMAQLLGLILGKIRQPRVIAEILGGILLGPTVFGRIPGFTNHIFPPSSLPYLSLTANIGLCLFLFIIGLEIDTGIIKRNARLSIAVSLAGVLLPFGVGCGTSVLVYRHLIDPSTDFRYFMLFIGVSFSITAFPVLCRILAALKLLDTTVGLIVLSAGVANDVIGWTLLALAVSFVNATSNLTALWTFLTCFAYTLLLLFPVKWALLWLARRTASTIHGPTMFYMTVVMLVLWASAFFTDIIGVNAIFGAFVVGVIVPRDGGISIAFVEKLEDMVQIIFIPLYFTISGLNTDLGLIDTGTAWGFVFAIATLDFSGKFTGCTLSSRALGFSWREATTVGSLMTCKGLVELIVLNVGLSAHILTRQVFSMFVLESLILTFMTTPLVNLIYPPKYRTFGLGAGTAPTPTDDETREKYISDASEHVDGEGWRYRFSVVLDEFRHMPGIMALTKLVLPPTSEDAVSGVMKPHKTSVNALRLLEFSERASSMMKVTMTEKLLSTDPLMGVFKMFGEQSHMSISASLSVVSHNEWAYAVADHAERHGSQLILIPWIPPTLSSTADSSEPGAKPELNPFDTFFGLSSKDNSRSTLYSHFVRGVFRHSKTDVALFVDMVDNAGTNGQQHVVLPFFGGPDDRLALELVVQLCNNPRVSATVIRVGRQAVIARPEPVVMDRKLEVEGGAPVFSSLTFPDTVYGKPNTAYFLQSDMADDLTWSRFASPTFEKDSHSQLRSALSRIEFTSIPHTLPLHALVQHVKQLREGPRRVLVVAGRSMRLFRADVVDELKQLMEEQRCTGHESDMVRRTIGDVAAAFVLGASVNGVIVVQAVEDRVVEV
ncbi:Sodium/hydrogen exchanger family-domain-containing protein [Boletus reticuloceps]|uniref:Sodium/hydrogen exchanger family-domain-containing protein n=1 Tax=Boletus reticuloceps TaxID=495285 RepID=A0A8I3AB23_9AGAM|nr:Sodium/hydrogen exchanger family-domain-containing protein [Boletus reticuloceps]